ncbi:MAG: flagellar protein [Rhodobacterales bacterium CG2_30_65_12]|nr:MAG: flagellar protein [Rhodobacterales bacterium CG2_30_65_12]
MGFQPIIPFGGMAGWTFLQRTQAVQQRAFEAAPEIKRDTDYFAKNIANVGTAADLVSDYRLLKVALGAFGLDDDLPNKAFIQKVLEEGSLDPDSFANRMVDKRYLALTEAFGFDLGTPSTQLSDFTDEILSNYNTRRFEIAVGAQDADMRLALALERDLGGIVDKDSTANGKWFSVMGNEPLRRVFETALGLPATLATLDIDKQLEVFRDRAKMVFGNGEVDHFSDPKARAELNRLFLVRSQIAAGSAGISPGAIALTLLGAI